MGKKIVKIVTILLVLVLVSTGVLVFVNFAAMSKNFENISPFSTEEQPKFHFMVILDGSNSNYISQFKEGAEAAARDYEVTYEFWDISGNEKYNDILQQFDIGVYSQVDGIIVCTYNTEPYGEVLARATDLGIPVVTLNEDIANVEKVSHIAFNQYRIGSRIGDVLNKALLIGGTIIVLQDEDNLQEDKARGIYDRVSDEYNVKTETIESEGENIFNAEGLTRQIINKYSDLRAIICTDSQVTMGVVQAIKDTNKVGDIIVIGNDITSEIKDFIDKEVIYATVIADYKKLGYICIETLSKYNQGEFVSSYPTIEVIIPSKDLIDIYLEEAGIVYEEATKEN